VSAPLNILTLYYYLAHYFSDVSASVGTTRAALLGAFGISSSVLLLLAYEGFTVMRRRREEHGIGWWGSDIDADANEYHGFRRAFTTLSLLAAWWLTVVCSVLEAHTRGAHGDRSALYVLRGLLSYVVTWETQ